MNTPYFKVVETKEEMETFKKIWLDVWNEKTYETEDFHTQDTGMHFLLKNAEGEYVGTLEAGKFMNNEESTVQYYYDFTQVDEISTHMDSSYECDKVCIYPEHRSTGLIKHAVYAILFHAAVTNGKYYPGAVEWTFYKALKRFYKVPIHEVGEKQKFNDFYLQPIWMDIEECIQVLKENNTFGIDFEELDKLANEYLKGTLHDVTMEK